ncbi:MAG: coenzyme F430 synthase [Methanomicrobiales archaeon]
MDLLVLDTIHGGKEIGDALVASGHHVDMIDVYRGTGAGDTPILTRNSYDRMIVPVHLNPDHPILKKFQDTPRISHHEAVKWILDEQVPSPMIEVTGAQGKTTTAHAIAHILPGCGILHTSSGTYRYPEKEKLFRKSITPASLLTVVKAANDQCCWLVAEESLGVTGAGELTIITSGLDYRVAAGKKSALAIKIGSTSHARRLLVAPRVHTSHPDTVHADEIIRIEGDRCDYSYHGIDGSFENPLLELAGYKTPLMIAAAAGCMLDFDPGALRSFTALQGRMEVTTEQGHQVIDNSNSGTTRETTLEAIRYTRSVSGDKNLLLVIGQEAHAVCEGFQAEEIIRTIEAVRPCQTIIVGDQYRNEYMDSSLTRYLETDKIVYTSSFREGRSRALASPGDACVVLAVKTWR